MLVVHTGSMYMQPCPGILTFSRLPKSAGIPGPGIRLHLHAPSYSEILYIRVHGYVTV